MPLDQISWVVFSSLKTQGEGKGKVVYNRCCTGTFLNILLSEATLVSRLPTKEMFEIVPGTLPRWLPA